MKFDQEYWASRYREQKTGWDLGEISPPLRAYINQLEDKSSKILIPGGGNAYEAEYLFLEGFNNVFVADIAQEPLENLKKRVPSFPPENLICQDFFELEGNVDLILEQTFFCALPVKMRKSYSEKIKELLKPEGKVVGVLFNTEFPADGPPFGGSKEEYLSYFKPLFKIDIMETCYNSFPARQGTELFFIFKKI